MKRLILLLPIVLVLLVLTHARQNINGHISAPANSNKSSDDSPRAFKWTPDVKLSDLISGVSVMIAVMSLIHTIRKDRQAKEVERKLVDADRKLVDADRKLVEAEVYAKDSAKILEKRLIERFGFEVGKLTLYINILDLDGTCTMHWTWGNVRIIRETTTLRYIPGMISFSPPEANITKPPELIPPTFSKPLRLRNLKCQPQMCEFQIEIVGSLSATDGMLDYEYQAEIYKGFLMSEEAVAASTTESFRKEFWAIDVVTPIKELEIEVRFPADYRVKTLFPGVCLGGVLSEDLMHGEELRLIYEKGGFKTNFNWARLNVKEPLIGFTYLLYWDPPRQTVVDALKQPHVK